MIISFYDPITPFNGHVIRSPFTVLDRTTSFIENVLISNLFWQYYCVNLKYMVDHHSFKIKISIKR